VLPRERFLQALYCETPDRVPIFENLFSPNLQEKLIGYRTPLYDGQAIVSLATELGIDGTTIPIGGFCGFEDQLTEGNTYTDEWGVTYVKRGWPIMIQTETPIKSRDDWNKYSLPDPRANHRAARLKDAIKANKDGIAICANILGPVTMMYWYLMDIQTLSISLFEDPALVVEMCDAYTSWALAAAEEIKKLPGIDAFIISDDWGTSNSLLISPKHLKAYFIKPFGDLVKGLRDLDYPVIMHNDGNLWEVLDDLVDTGINGYHPVEKAATMDLATIKKKYKSRLCPIGNVNNKTVMVFGTKEDVVDETLSCLQAGGPGGGYIISTDHSLHDDIPEENVWAFINTARKFGKYPLKFNASV
jgi:uroporphyrinogen decarboxylase